MADGSVRDEITAALVAAHGWATCESDTADALLPVVERLQRQAAAKALREAAGVCDYTPLSERSAHEGGLSESTRGWHAAGAMLRDRADGIEAT